MRTLAAALEENGGERTRRKDRRRNALSLEVTRGAFQIWALLLAICLCLVSLFRSLGEKQ